MHKFKVKQVQRSTLYYSKWKYAIDWHFQHSGLLHKLSHKDLDAAIRYREGWDLHNRHTTLTQTVKGFLHAACDYLLTREHPYKKVVCHSQILLYTNYLDDFAELEYAHPVGRVVSVTEADVCLPADVVTLEDPQHAFRTYFKECWLADEQLSRIVKYFDTRASQFRFGPGFSGIMTGRRRYMSRGYFVDHNEPDADLFINIAVPGLVKKTLPIVGRC